ncbi:hypothetical protein BDN70DRAFT_255042 [Pholiota conissans]|uniref:Uncharacterized protein n=1 Tax=Pholiota conissans TaxID=109636 RepID=A0A9P5YWV1_9AGAR|nr:hypothetical protein BDN70DRAFT_255042 [Pholiota conissans]
MQIFSGLDSSVCSETALTLSKPDPLNRIESELLQLVNAADDTLEAKLGLSSSARITLEVMLMAQQAKSHRKVCINIADQTYQLFNALDGGVKGRAIDINGILRDHIVRLNEDLVQIRKIIKYFTSWWSISRIWKARRRLQKCYDILSNAMQMYLLLLKYSLSRPIPKRRLGDRKRWPGPSLTVPPSRPRRVKDQQRRSEKMPQGKTPPRPRPASAIAKPPYRNRTSASAGVVF